MLRISEIEIKNIGAIQDLKLSFDSSFNIICGKNGIGKTTILDCLAQSFSNTPIVSRSSNSEAGEWVIEFTNEYKTYKQKIDIIDFEPIPKNKRYIGSERIQLSEKVIVFKTHRDIAYSAIRSIDPDKIKDTNNYINEILKGSNSTDIKQWFIHRYLFSHIPERGLTETQINNYDLAVSCFGKLNETVLFDSVTPDFYDLMLNTPNGKIHFEYLSSGYKSCLAVILGLIKEIEFRYKNPGIKVEDFDGIIIIDEIDLHLHPEWQAKMYLILKEILPNAQIFTSTHSPHVVQIAKSSEIIALIADEDGKVYRNDIINEEYGCQGWTVEEILRDVMGMTETRTDFYTSTINQFDEAMKEENYQKAKQAYDVLSKMLHPENSLNKILKIQLASLGSDD
jgi:predicted ATP-binding protein involved in virulence